jgi:uncharacterized protein YajQ (UPF0234 family)
VADVCSFDITTGCVLQEVDNAINQARKELQQRYDFKNVVFELLWLRDQEKVTLSASDEMKLEAIWEVLMSKCIRRGVPVKNLHRGKIEAQGGQGVKQEICLQQSIETEVAKKIAKHVRDLKWKKLQVTIMGDHLRVSSPSRDDLQNLMKNLRQADFGIELNFGNYR